MIASQQSQRIEPLNHISVTQSLQGICVPIVFGTVRVPGLLVWTADFKATKHNVAGGSGFGAKGSATYTYTASWISLLCQGPIQAIHSVWDQSGQYVAQNQTTSFTIPAGGSGDPPANAGGQPGGPTPDPRYGGDQGITDSTGRIFNRINYDAIGGASVPALTTGQYAVDNTGRYAFSSSDTGTVITIYNSYFYNNRMAQELHVVPGSTPYTFHPDQGGTISDYTGSHNIFVGDWGARYYSTGALLTKVSGSPAVGQYAVSESGGVGTYTFNSGDANQEIIINYEYYDSTDDRYAPHILNITFFPGVLGQAAWSSLSSGHPDQTVGYSLSAYAGFQNAYLGMSASPPVSSYEITGFNAVGGGILDASPIDALNTLLTDAQVGIGFPSAMIDQATWYTNGDAAQKWVKSQNLFISTALSNQESVASVASRWLEAYQVAFFFSEGLLKLKPFGDQSVTGTLATYTADVTPVASFTDDDFLSPSTKARDPLTFSQTPYADRYNRTQVNYKNRYNSYNSDLVYEQDEASVERFGLRIEPPISYDFITTPQPAAAAASMRLKRNVSIRNTYTCHVSSAWAYIEPMDLIQITDSRLGLSAVTVRVTRIQDDPKKGLAVTFEDFPAAGYGMPVNNPKASTPPLHPPHGTAGAGPTQVVAMAIGPLGATLEPTGLYVWCAGWNPNWGGCTVWVSLDGTNYNPIEVVLEPARIGTLKAALSAVSYSPTGNFGTTTDTTNTLDVQLIATSNDASSTAIAGWSSTASYTRGQIVTYDSQLWACLQPNTNSQPTISNTNWQLMVTTLPTEAALTSVSASVAQNLGTLSVVLTPTGTANDLTANGIEFLSYQNVAAGSLPNEYLLTTLYRGAYNADITTSPAGSFFVRFKDASVFYTLPQGFDGSTIYFRFTAANALGGSSQSVDDAPTYALTLSNSRQVRKLWGGTSTSGSLLAGVTTFAKLPAGPQGSVYQITDCNSNGPGAIAAGGGSYTVFVGYDGTNWIIL